MEHGGLLAGLLIAMPASRLQAAGLRPKALRLPLTFVLAWLRCSGGCSLSANTLALTWQRYFWQGVVMVLLHSIGARAAALALALTLWTLLLELLQTLLPGRTADITPARCRGCGG